MKKMMGGRPNYVAKKSIFEVIRGGWIIFVIFGLPLLVAAELALRKLDLFNFWFIPAAVYGFFLIWFLLKVLVLKQTKIEFYDERIVVREGLLTKREKVMLFMGVTSVRKVVPFWGLVFGYGDLYISGVSDFDVRTTRYIKRPRKLQGYLNRHIVSSSDTNRVVNIG
jgi:uncharacterized membrane protein YdbT with pleckstrin-like domain